MKKPTEEQIKIALRAWWTCALETGKTSPEDAFRAGVKWVLNRNKQNHYLLLDN